MKRTTLLVLVNGAAGSDPQIVNLEGPRVSTRSELADLAVDVLRRPAIVTSVPRWLMWLVVTLTRLFDRQHEDLLAFPTSLAAADEKAPSSGAHASEPYIKYLWGER
jgi:hypothetical protein